MENTVNSKKRASVAVKIIVAVAIALTVEAIIFISAFGVQVKVSSGEQASGETVQIMTPPSEREMCDALSIIANGTASGNWQRA